MHSLSSAFVLGYHGCDQTAAEKVLRGSKFLPSANAYDWLGSGIYFWEANPKRGLEFAVETSRRARASSNIKVPCVVGAVIDLGLCLDLTTSQGIAKIAAAHDVLLEIVKSSGGALPKNSLDGLHRNLDCAVVNLLHEILLTENEPPVDSVKGIFVEGGPIYPGSGFHSKTHVQICVRNARCIKGVFRVPESELT